MNKIFTLLLILALGATYVQAAPELASPATTQAPESAPQSTSTKSTKSSSKKQKSKTKHKGYNTTISRFSSSKVSFVPITKDKLPGDSLISDSIMTDTVQVKKSLWGKVKDYLSLDGGQKVVHEDEAPFSILGGPYYESTTGFGISLMAASRFRFTKDSTVQASNAMVSFSYTTKKFWDLVLKGTINLPNGGTRLNFLFDYEYQPSYFWGIGYAQGDKDDNMVMQKKHDCVARAELLFNLADNLYVGPCIQWDYMQSDSIAKPELREGQPRDLRHYGFGATLEYDTRDFPTDAQHGVYLYLGQTFRPKFLWNDYAFSTTEFRASYYHPLWKGCTAAAEVAGKFNFGNPSWDMLSLVGDRYRMRGYYNGRYRDKHMLIGQLELRQWVWKRLGVVAWVGGGSIFHSMKTIDNVLLNAGFGVRFAFRRHMNVRLDFGYGRRGQSAMMVNINEAF